MLSRSWLVWSMMALLFSGTAAAQSRGKISETELQIIQIDQDLSSEVAKDMREVDAKYGEFVELAAACPPELKLAGEQSGGDWAVVEWGACGRRAAWPDRTWRGSTAPDHA